jgi:lipopolysaccharide/colanic/teichoic acid biosynthesis glycosyltransferase
MLDGDAAASESVYSPDYLLLAEMPVDSWRYQYVKRAFDMLFALFMILLLMVPGLLIAAAILLTSKGPVFYREERIGRDGHPFCIWKFRSMHRNALQLEQMASAQSREAGLQWRMHKPLRDPRITPIGSFLRRWSLDELPQLFNVLRGEMSLIGPRPIVAAEVDVYGDLVRFYLAASPGLSGLWQVSGRSNIDYPKRAELDAIYVRSWSLRTDLNIFFQTIPAVLGRIGAR